MIENTIGEDDGTMWSRTVRVVLLGACVALSASVSGVAQARDPADLSDLAHGLRKSGECVAGLLRSMPGVQAVKLGAVRNRIRVFAVIAYDIVDQAGMSRTVEFDLWSPAYSGTDAIYDVAYALGLDASDKALLQY